MTKKLDTEVRKQQIIEVAADLSEEHGYLRFTRDQVAGRIGCATGLINHHFGTMNQLRRSVMRYAVTEHRLKIIAQGLINSDPHAVAADEELKQAAMNVFM